MVIDVVMPKMGESITDGTILEWYKKVGEHIAADETLLEIGTDKVDSEIPAPNEGIVIEILAQPNDVIDVGEVIARIETSKLETDNVQSIENSDEPMKGLHFASTGCQDDRWYNWRVQNWGTKWDCYSLEIDDSDMPHGFEVQFETAWSPPEEICNAIRDQYDDLSISWFYDEPGCEVAGYL